ncbi:MAG: hypothetical protein QGI83_09865 [Candidatus Latescibacteria bacterium]|jgi:MYXO-CTERM domain-containing protein|nr:hypothetical protein [Candidatus Latescibacterota bacterium]
MGWKIVSLLAFGLTVTVGVWWLADGAEVFTKTARQTIVSDGLFQTQGVQWEEGLWIGLDVSGPAVLFLLVLGAFAWRRTRKSGSSTDVCVEDET